MKSAKRGNVPPFFAMEVLKAANKREAEGKVVYHMEIGQPATSAPSKVTEAAEKALRDTSIGYTEALGIPPLRKAIADHYGRMYNIDLDPARVVVTTGSSTGFMLSFLSLFNAGDRVVLADPGYPAYRNILSSLDIEAVGIPTGPETNFQPSPALIDAVPGPLHGLLVASPSNPTGTMLSPTELSALVDYCRDRDMHFISDEIYHGLTYSGEAKSALSYTDDVVVINSFSKYFSMTGWRLGWMIVPEALVGTIERLSQSLFISAPSLSQYAAIAAFDCTDELEGYRENYTRNRAILLEELPKMGLDKLASADGAFYIYADVSHLTDDSMEFCKRMLAETGVAATPGLDFDPNRGQAYVRFSFAGSTESVKGAIEALRGWL
ncbi:pyridoxal phosphate-dependent aminotransferase [Sneathiella chinensis]|uniref:Aminotransferase n=1 Tax=Sneathiella chinensis TaxID=349750 RepID=A0ABQ5U7C8_9PROT|nr:aminotransferase class I/II-fold pyridoxal phosphate-dependent enzyme [Sneathiella chinensis]GLQ07060.1 aminotransferase [Sneathiella chinensis]